MSQAARADESARLMAEIAALEQQLIAEHQMASIGRLLASIVHEINSPIGAIFSNNEVTLRSLEKMRELLDDGSPESLAKAGAILESIQGLASVDKIACDRIGSVIRGLKTFARVDASERRKADLNENLRNTLKLTQAEFRRRVTVETDFGEIPEIECYPHMLNQVFLNLLVNAGHAIEGQGVITVRTRAEGPWVHVSISDTGRGMDAETQRHIFTPGYTTKPVGVGTGLGLSISRRIVEEKHGGSITFESEPGVGTTFHVRIPAGETPGA
ncbi:MAG TPA: HAMP domain-containing sensor histidine kinase [Bryobacteraceae bacterium]|nr:HAMP domain-containing sensor histidine kinase [Bryobacteraceae bacterium]